MPGFLDVKFMPSPHSDDYRPKWWKLTLFNAPKKCIHCGGFLEISHFQKNITAFFNLVFLISGLGYCIKLKSSWPLWLSLALILLSQIILARYGRIVVVSLYELKLRRRINSLTLIILVVLFGILLLFDKNHF